VHCGRRPSRHDYSNKRLYVQILFAGGAGHANKKSLCG
jgi:hypothetical protein